MEPSAHGGFNELSQAQLTRKRGRQEYHDTNLESGVDLGGKGDQDHNIRSEEFDSVAGFKRANLESSPQSKRPKVSQDQASVEWSDASYDKPSSNSISPKPSKQSIDDFPHIAHNNMNSGEHGAAIYEHCILYRVVCSDQHERCHRRMYQDEPRAVAMHGIHHLSGQSLVPDLDDFLRDRAKTAFVVYRDFYCGRGAGLSLLGSMTGRPSTKYFRELVAIVREDLHSIIQRISKFAPDEEAYQIRSSEDHRWKSSPALSTSPSVYSHRFLYHHRKEIATESAAAPDGSAIKALASYIRNDPSDMYKKCDDLFAQGRVSHDTLPWLYHPNDVVVSNRGPLQIAYVLRRFPIEGSRLEFLGWNWGFDGYWLRRKDTTLKVDLPTHGEGMITELAVYPLHFADAETKERLFNNGNKFWTLRQQVAVSYEGLDYEGENTYPPESRFMIDYQTYFKLHGNSELFNFSTKDPAVYDSWPQTISNQTILSTTHITLLPPGIHGFYLKQKKWS